MNLTGANYVGETTTDGYRPDGCGEYTFPNRDKYVGEFLDGRFHGSGVIFFASKNTAASSGASENIGNSLQNFLGKNDQENVQKDDYNGQYRGTWEHGKNVSGCYVFSDGLVLSKEKDQGDSWPYCRGEDHRLWTEYLKKITPVLPSDSVLGGETLQNKKYKDGNEWQEAVVWAPSTLAQELVPPSFAEGQPRTANDVPKDWWKSPEMRKKVISLLNARTPLLSEKIGTHAGPVAEGEANLSTLRLLPTSLESGGRYLVPCSEIGSAVAPQAARHSQPGGVQSEVGSTGHTTDAVVGTMPEYAMQASPHHDGGRNSVLSIHGVLDALPVGSPHSTSADPQATQAPSPSAVVGAMPEYALHSSPYHGDRPSVVSMSGALNEGSLQQ